MSNTRRLMTCLQKSRRFYTLGSSEYVGDSIADRPPYDSDISRDRWSDMSYNDFNDVTVFP